MKLLKIGLMLPDSTIFPIAKDYEKGLVTALSDTAEKQTFELIKEFVGQAGTKMAETAISRFSSYHEADVITGILSGTVTESIADKVKNQQLPLLVSDLGANLPNATKLNEYVFLNSFHLWQHAWAMGYWGVKTFGKKGMFISSVYDAGYSFSHLFYEGMMAADPTSNWSFSVPPMPPAGQHTNMDVIFPYLEKYQPDFVFAAFCGRETTLFLNKFISRGWHKKTRVLGLPFLLCPFTPLANDITIYTSQLSAQDTPIEPEGSFYYLGYQAGVAIRQALQHQTGNIYQSLLQNSTIQSFGDAYLLQHQKQHYNEVTIFRNEIIADSPVFSSLPADTITALSITDEYLLTPNNDLKFGWMNPYLCI